jgi:hypothetical protein
LREIKGVTVGEWEGGKGEAPDEVRAVRVCTGQQGAPALPYVKPGFLGQELALVGLAEK